MSAKPRTIRVDDSTAERLEQRASERGISVSQLVAELADHELKPLEVSPEEIAELDREWAAAQAAGTIPHSTLVQWLNTWGTSDFKPWREY
jgi:predicted transcriptional regulator